MTVDDRLTRRLAARLETIADARLPAYIDDVLAVTSRTRQRPGWTFPARWLPVDVPSAHAALAPLSWRLVALLALLVLAGTALALAYAGSRPRLPAPFGPAANGMIAFARDGDILVVDEPGAVPRVLVGGPGADGAPIFSPDGTRLMFTRTVRHNPFLMVVASDGGTPIEVLPEPLIEPTAFAWSPDGRSIAIASMVRGSPRISIAAADGSGARVLELGMILDSPAWRPPDGRELLVRGRDVDGRRDLYVVDVRSGAARPLGLARAEASSEEPFFLAWQRLRNPAWSPDGTLIAYQTIDEAPAATSMIAAGKTTLIHVVSADGTGDRILDGSAPEVEQLMPRWSPDGTRLLIAQRRSVPNRPAEEWWWGVVDAGGGRGADLGSRVRDREGLADWAPDGTRVIAVVGQPWARSTTEWPVRLFDPASGAETEASWTSADQPTWQRLAP